MQTEQRIEAEAELRSGHAQEIVHDQREPAKQRLELRGAFAFLPAEELPTRLPVAAVYDRRTFVERT